MKPMLPKKSLPQFRRRVRRTDAAQLVRTSLGDRDTGLPAVFHANSNNLVPADWAKMKRDELLACLDTHGVLLFRGFSLESGVDFQTFAGALVPGLYGDYGDLPKERENIYHSTPYPEDRMILFHNESSHLDRWPTRQMFFCVTPSPEGGATPIADGGVVATLLSPADLALFRHRKLRYIRNFLPGLDVSWRDFFKTESREEVAQYCERTGMSFEWHGDDGLSLFNDAEAVIDHPVHGNPIFFNQVQLHHPFCLEPDVRTAMTNLYGMDRFPRNVTFGDGSPISSDLMARVGEAYEAAAIRFQWQTGDVLMLDNTRFAHARDPFRGPRKILVAMADLCESKLDTCAPAGTL